MVPREFDHNVGVGVPDIALRSGMYYGSRYLLRSLGMASGFATPIAAVLVGLDFAYVE